MTETVGVVDPRDARIAELEAQLEAKKKSGWKAKLGAVAAGVLAALTTPEAVKAEKKIAATVLVRLAITVPAVALYVDLILKALGAPSVSP